MSETTDVNDLFRDDPPAPTAPPAPTETPKPKDDKPPRSRTPKPKPAAAKIVVEDLSDDELAAMEANEPRKKVRAAAEAEIQRRAENAKPIAATDKTVLIDNAVNTRRLDWECVCGNTNTLDLQRCGKCREPRYS